jgi:hypothetical protein
MSTVTVAAIPAGRRPLAAAVWTFAAVAVGVWAAGAPYDDPTSGSMLERDRRRPGWMAR